MTNDEASPNAPAFAALRRSGQMMNQRSEPALHRSDFVSPSPPDIRHSSSASDPIASDGELAALIEQISAADRVAVDTEADSLHSYREKLCLLQMSVPAADNAAGYDFIVDPLAGVDLEPLRRALEPIEIVLHGADYDLRMLRRGLNFIAHRIFDTMIAARLLGIREFSLAALVKRYFGLDLPKGSQKANWAKRPLPARMAEYAINDVHYLLRLAKKLEAELEHYRRRDWLRQSCERAIEQAALARVRQQDELWRVRGSGSIRGPAAAVLRALWQWREREAEVADRPPFHILQNENLLNAAASFASGTVPDYKHFSRRRREAFREAARIALAAPESEWPVLHKRFGTRPTTETLRLTEELRRRRDKSAEKLGLEPSFIAPRNTLESIAIDQTRATTLLVPWQWAALGL
jgi:ribonuclease D